MKQPTHIQRAHHQLNNLETWRGKYPNLLTLATSHHTPNLPKTHASHASNPGLPFNLLNWLDETQLGMEGAKTWPAIETELSA